MKVTPIKYIKAAVKRGQIVHAYLFLGQNLLAKAFELSKALNCLNFEETGETCDSCSNCYKIQNHCHPDIINITPEGNSIKINQIRELQKGISYKIHEGKYKVIIIEEADKLTIEAANSLLKTLEEPLPQTVFILLAESQKNIPDTIVSRCQRVYFGQEIEHNDYEDVKKILVTLLAGDYEKIYDIIENLQKEDKEIISQKINTLMILLRDLLVFSNTEDETLLTTDISQIVSDLKYINEENIIKIIDNLHDGLKALDGNVNKRLLLESLFLKFRKIT